MELAPGIAAGVFSGPAILALTNAGSAVTVGLPPYLLAQTMVVSLSGGGLSVGGVVYSVSLEQADTPQDLSADDPQDVPEANSGVLLLGGGALLIGLGVATRCYARWGRR
jgi:hypothetical protein